jgi:holo-[acyl-carrier protein] synthase
MPICVGIDLVTSEEVRESLQAHGDRYLKRVYTEQELQDCGRDPRRLAGRFAAKEAAMKALARADEALAWHEIGVRTDSSGRFALELSGAAATLAQRRGISDLQLSITQRRSGAAALVLAKAQGGV